MRRQLTEINSGLCSTNGIETRRALGLLSTVLRSLISQISLTRFNTPTLGPLATFIDLQNDFECNLASHMMQYYRWIVATGLCHVRPDDVVTCNRLLQGLLLIHPRSRSVFSLPENMSTLLSLVSGENALYAEITKNHAIELELSFVLTLIHVILKNIKNYRTFEQCGGCPAVINLFKLAHSQPHEKLQGNPITNEDPLVGQQNLNFKIVEFLIVYMADELVLDAESCPRKTAQEKCALFRPHFAEIDTLVQNLNILKES